MKIENRHLDRNFRMLWIWIWTYIHRINITNLVKVVLSNLCASNGFTFTIFEHFSTVATAAYKHFPNNKIKSHEFFGLSWPIGTKLANSACRDIWIREQRANTVVFSGTRRSVRRYYLLSLNNNNIIFICFSNSQPFIENISHLCVVWSNRCSHRITHTLTRAPHKNVRRARTKPILSNSLFHRKLSFLLPIKISRFKNMAVRYSFQRSRPKWFVPTIETCADVCTFISDSLTQRRSARIRMK